MKYSRMIDSVSSLLHNYEGYGHEGEKCRFHLVIDVIDDGKDISTEIQMISADKEGKIEEFNSQLRQPL